MPTALLGVHVKISPKSSIGRRPLTHQFMGKILLGHVPREDPQVYHSEKAWQRVSSRMSSEERMRGSLGDKRRVNATSLSTKDTCDGLTEGA